MKENLNKNVYKKEKMKRKLKRKRREKENGRILGWYKVKLNEVRV